jgi:hypothetical protein
MKEYKDRIRVYLALQQTSTQRPCHTKQALVSYYCEPDLTVNLALCLPVSFGYSDWLLLEQAPVQL